MFCLNMLDQSHDRMVMFEIQILNGLTSRPCFFSGGRFHGMSFSVSRYLRYCFALSHINTISVVLFYSTQVLNFF